MLITTLDFALRNFLDITSIIVGWGQSGEAGGKAHFAGVGFGGENALIHALELAYRGHGYGVADFQYLVAHATGTRTNSKTDLTTAANARVAAASGRASKAALPTMTVGTPKAVGDGHTMGETGLKAVSQAIAVSARQSRPSAFRRCAILDPDLGPVADSFVLRCAAGRRRHATAVPYARRKVSAATTAPSRCAPRTPKRSRATHRIAKCSQRIWSAGRSCAASASSARRYWRLRRRSAIELAQTHCWQGVE